MAEIDSWVEAQEFQITLDAQGKIIDYIDNETRRPNTPEERIRQKMAQILALCKALAPDNRVSLGGEAIDLNVKP